MRRSDYTPMGKLGGIAGQYIPIGINGPIGGNVGRQWQGPEPAGSGLQQMEIPESRAARGLPVPQGNAYGYGQVPGQGLSQNLANRLKMANAKAYDAMRASRISGTPQMSGQDMRGAGMAGGSMTPAAPQPAMPKPPMQAAATSMAPAAPASMSGSGAAMGGGDNTPDYVKQGTENYKRNQQQRMSASNSF
jgi:hypothetical protein